MEKEKFFEKLKLWIVFATYCLVLGVILFNINDFIGSIKQYIGLLNPLYYAIGFAFILNLPMVKIENFLKERLNVRSKILRPLSILLTIIFAIVLLYIIATIIFPQVANSIVTLVSNVPSYLEQIQQVLTEIITQLDLNIDIDILSKIPIDDLAKKLSEWVYAFTPVFFGNTLAFTSKLATVFMGFMLSIYLLASKETFIRQIKKVLVAFFGFNISKKILSIGKRANHVFSNFVSGQLVEAVILGILCYIGMVILKFPFAVLISTVVSITAIIPIFGAIFGMIFGCFLILAINPIQVLWFILYFQLLQQLEGNFIYPIVVGSSLGLPGIWVLLSIVVFGNMFGLLGMLIAVPMSALIYSLFVDFVNNILDTKRGRFDYETLEPLPIKEKK